MDYGYDSVDKRLWTKRDGGTGDVFGYDYADQVTAVKLNIPNTDTTAPGAQTIVYDANGNRTSFSAYGPTDTYALNNLNQYTSRSGTNAAYDNNGNLVTGVDGSSYTYDAQNRITSAYKSGVTETFKYDGLNRQVSRTINGVTTYNIWDGWDLIIQYQGVNSTGAYLYGAGEPILNLQANYYYQDASGSTSHLADSTGHLIEWYRYDLQGTPVFYNAANAQIPSSNYGIRHLFTGQQWYADVGLYDLRNRFYSPDIGRFLQPDPIDFNGDPTNLYRYCGNNPVRWKDPIGYTASPDWIQHAPRDWDLAGVNIPIHYLGGTPEQQNLISWAMGDYLSKISNYSIPVYVTAGEANKLVIQLSEQPDQTLPPIDISQNFPGQNNWAAIFFSKNESKYRLYYDAGQIGAFFMGDFLQELKTSEDENGFTYLYDSNWNWIGSGVYYQVLMSDGTTYVYNSDWQWVRTISSGGRGASGRGGGGSSGGFGVGPGGVSGGAPGFGPGFSPGSYGGIGFGLGFFSLGFGFGPGGDLVKLN